LNQKQSVISIFISGFLHILVRVTQIRDMEEILLKSERTTQSFKRTFHLYQDGDKYFLRQELYKSKNRKQHIFSDEFEIELINLIIHLPSPFDGMAYRYYIWIPALNFVLSKGMAYGEESVKDAERMCNDREYEMRNKYSGEFVKNYIRKVKLKSILD